MPLFAGIHLGPYEVLAPIGAGGMGEVYCARDARLGRDVALKILPAAFASDPDRARRFEQEGRAAAALNHPNIVVIYDAGSQDGVFYVANELLEGRRCESGWPVMRCPFARQSITPSRLRAGWRRLTRKALFTAI